MYYKVEITSGEEAVGCPNCGRAVMVVRQPARLYGECACGAKMEFTQRRAVYIPKIKLDLSSQGPNPGTPTSP